MKSPRLLLCTIYAITSFCACNRNNVTSIPNLPVYLSLDLGGEYATFYGNVNASLEFTKPRLETDRIGYGGILVYVPLFDAFGQYVAFDMACPHEVDRNIRVHHDGNGNAVCEKCGSAFLLVDGTGVRTSGPAKENLKRYRADLRLTNTSRKLIITR